MTGAAHALADRSTAGSARGPGLALLIALPLLAGCGGARLSEETSAAAAGPPPARLLVVTDGGQAIGQEADPALVSRTASALTEAIVQGLTERGIPAEVASPDRAGPDAARLALTLRRVEEGSRIQRIAFGFGFGRSRIEVTARLQPPGTATPDLLAFQGAAHSGYRPGLIMPLGVGLGAQSAMALVGVAGVGVAEMRHRGTGGDVRDLAETVVERTATYYRQVGWGPQAAPLSYPIGGAVMATPVAEFPRRG